MSTVLLDICLILTLLGVIGLTSIRGAYWGPEGPVGLFLLVIPVLLLFGGVLTAFVSRGLFAWAPGGRPVHYAAVLGVVVALGILILVSVDRNQGPLSHLCTVIPYLVIAACFATLHINAGRSLSAGFVGLLAVAGWVAMAGGLVMQMSSSIKEAETRATAERLAEELRAKEDLEEFRQLSAGASLAKLLQYTYSPNATVQKEAREMIASNPRLDDELIAMLRMGSGEDASSYIARLHPAPTAKLAPAFASFLERELPGWKSRLMGAPNPGIWQPNISSYFDGADRIQKAGGDLRPQLRQWHDYLKGVSGMSGMAMHIAPMLN
jgi:hypothetical protein